METAYENLNDEPRQGEDPVIGLFADAGLEEYIDTLSENAITEQVLLSMNKEELLKTLNLKYSDILIVEKLLNDNYQRKHSYYKSGQNSAQRRQFVQQQNYNYVDQQRLLDFNNASSQPQGVYDFGNGEYKIKSTNALTMVGMIFFGISAFLFLIFGSIFGRMLAQNSTMYVVFTGPIILLVMGLAFTKCLTGKLKHVTLFNDNTRTVNVGGRSAICMKSKSRIYSYDDILSVNINSGNGNVRINGGVVRHVSLRIRGIEKSVQIGTTTSFLAQQQWQDWIGKRLRQH